MEWCDTARVIINYTENSNIFLCRFCMQEALEVLRTMENVVNLLVCRPHDENFRKLSPPTAEPPMPPMRSSFNFKHQQYMNQLEPILPPGVSHYSKFAAFYIFCLLSVTDFPFYHTGIRNNAGETAGLIRLYTSSTTPKRGWIRDRALCTSTGARTSHNRW